MADGDSPSEFKLYHYTPSKAAPVIFILLFLAITTQHTWQMIKHKTWFLTAFIIGGIFEIVGYIARAISARQAPDYTLMPYIVQSLLLLLGPSFFAASIYMILGRLIVLVGGQKHSIIRPKWLTKIFVVGDVLSFFVQSGGGGMLAKASTPSSASLANNIVLGGLILQVLFFGLFVLVASIFHARMRGDLTLCATASSLPWSRYLWVLYVGSLLIVVRCVFRIAEYAGGQEGVLMGTETYLYVFDAALMVLVMVVFSVQHPRMIIGREKVAGYRMDQLYS
ncbi:hypothetical protein WHR41_08289 [Cladosporium halotolerans]|uniref:Uncharacterized protein n=1 Tax=Cladosporium halotolerans TaxID=1052096 RepID=A0AB34KG71_9PEZI